MSTINPPRVYDKNLKLVVVLKNAFNIGYTKIKNNLWTCQFTMPLNDKNIELIKPKNFIDLYDHDKYIGKFIVNPKHTVKSLDTNEVTYECEHVLSLLHSDVLFGYHQYSNYTTDVVLEGLFSAQEIKHWKLGTLDFKRFFHYGYENEESLLNAIMSVPKPFNDPYVWTWDDTDYPFILNLVRPDDTLKGTIITGKNIQGIEVIDDPTSIVTRIYPLGAGEGINQLNISEVNNGSVYLEDAEAIEKYGLHKRIWVDGRFENAESLKSSGQAILDKFKQPIRSVRIDAIDYAQIDPYKLSDYDVGDVLLVYDQDTKINDKIILEKIEKRDIYGAPYDMQMELGSVLGDITTTFADLEHKQLVNDTYSQGSTNIDSRDFSDNCDPNYPAIIRFPIPDDVVNINEMLLTFETLPFRAHSRAIEGGGAIVTSTSAGGGSFSSTSAGGGSYSSTGAGGGSFSSTGSGGGSFSSTSAGGGDYRSTDSGGESVQSSSAENYRVGTDGHNHGIKDGTQLSTTDGNSVAWTESGQHEHRINIPAHDHTFSVANHTHTLSLSNHTHTVSIDNHTHTVSIDNHAHTVSIDNHTHSIMIPNHTHEIEYGIFESHQTPSKLTIKVDGNTLPINETYGDDINIIPYLAKDESGRIARGRYAEIEITPNRLARINATVTSRLFIQSRLGVIM